MSTTQIILMSVKTAIFIYWGYLWFRTLFLLRKRGAQKTGSTYPGPFTTLSELKNFMTSPEDRSDRNRVGIVTLILIASIALSVIMAQPGNLLPPG